ncbi:MAG: hydroxyacid dehydrogenase [candidate division Zixibacteria bacterium]|nr:hydroxyacid dehydrogenase [candidate division Zixibacteria bacterium]
MSLPVVFIPEYIDKAGKDLLTARYRCIAPWFGGAARLDAPREDAMRSHLYEADAVIVRVFTISADDMRRAENLKVVVKHGVGFDNIDVAAVTARGIPVAYTPTGNTNAVAEHAMALMLSLMRRIVPAGEALRAGRFADRNDFQGEELEGKTLGIVGVGRIGSLVARKAAFGFGMNVIAFDPYVSPERYDGPAVLTDFETVMKTADIVTFHVPLTRKTRRMVDARTLAFVRPSCRIVNTSRGGVIAQEALTEALHDGRIAGAALDVFEEEPIPPDHPLCRLPNVVLTPHIGGLTQTAMRRTALLAAQAVIDALEGRTPEYIVNQP